MACSFFLRGFHIFVALDIPIVPQAFKCFLLPAFFYLTNWALNCCNGKLFVFMLRFSPFYYCRYFVTKVCLSVDPTVCFSSVIHIRLYQYEQGFKTFLYIDKLINLSLEQYHWNCTLRELHPHGSGRIFFLAPMGGSNLSRLYPYGVLTLLCSLNLYLT